MTAHLALAAAGAEGVVGEVLKLPGLAIVGLGEDPAVAGRQEPCVPVPLNGLPAHDHTAPTHLLSRHHHLCRAGHRGQPRRGHTPHPRPLTLLAPVEQVEVVLDGSRAPLVSLLGPAGGQSSRPSHPALPRLPVEHAQPEREYGLASQPARCRPAEHLLDGGDLEGAWHVVVVSLDVFGLAVELGVLDLAEGGLQERGGREGLPSSGSNTSHHSHYIQYYFLYRRLPNISAP